MSTHTNTWEESYDHEASLVSRRAKQIGPPRYVTYVCALVGRPQAQHRRGTTPRHVTNPHDRARRTPPPAGDMSDTARRDQLMPRRNHNLDAGHPWEPATPARKGCYLSTESVDERNERWDDGRPLWDGGVETDMGQESSWSCGEKCFKGGHA